MKTNLKAIALSIVMAGTLAITSILPVSIENTVQAKSNKIQYNNSIFTDKLYKKIENGETLGSIELWDLMEDLFNIHQRKLRQISENHLDKANNL